MLRTLMLILLFLFSTLPARATPPGDDPLLMPLGLFNQSRGDGEHSYGHSFALWHHGDRLVGEVLHWDGDIEGNRGEFRGGQYDPQTGALSFEVTMHPPGNGAEIDIAHFEGRLQGGRVSGQLRWNKGTFAEAKTESLSLPLDRDEIAVPLRLSVWRKDTGKRTLQANADCAAFDRAGRSAAVSSQVGPGPIELQATVARSGRLPFHSGPAAHCKTRLFIIRGDRVSVGVPFNGYRPITYVAKDGKVHHTWVDASALDIQPLQFE